MIGFMVRSGVISDELWAVLEPVLPVHGGRRGRPWNDHRLTLEAICWRFRTGSLWRDLPAEFGAWQSIWERHRRWSTDGTYTGAGHRSSTSCSTGGATPSSEASATSKQWRGITTRYDKYALTYLGGLTLAAITIHHRTRN
jgi:transposase